MIIGSVGKVWNFKTLKEAREYKSIAGDKAYIIDNVTGKRID